LTNEGDIMQIDYNKPLDEFTLEEVDYLYQTFGDSVMLRNGHVVGFIKNQEEDII
jgi:hypothetical protein